MSNGEKRAWILGAGFSYPLGSPLFHEIYSEGLHNISHVYLDRLASTAGKSHTGGSSIYKTKLSSSIAAQLYSRGLGSKGVARCWSNPEQFLQRTNDSLGHPQSTRRALYAEIARSTQAGAWLAKESIEGKRLTKDDSEFLKVILLGAKIELAIEVSMFLDGVNGKEECWIPYRRWASRLSESDTIITFNYDLAVETAFKAEGRSDMLHVPLPQGEAVGNEPKIALIKLHGSVDWASSHGCSPQKLQSLDQTILSHESVGIFTHGPEKCPSSQSNPIWMRAARAIQEADRIAIIGYRFPEADIYAQQVILRALRRSNRRKNVDVVLGPEIDRPEVARVIEMLSGAAATPTAKRLFCQDYLSVFNYATA